MINCLTFFAVLVQQGWVLESLASVTPIQRVVRNREVGVYRRAGVLAVRAGETASQNMHCSLSSLSSFNFTEQ